MTRALATLCCLAFATSAAAEVPLSVARSGHVTVPVTVDDAGPYDFVLDTGAEGTAVYARFAVEKGWPLHKATETLIGQTGSAEVSLVSLAKVAVDGSTSRGIRAVRLDDRKDGVPLAGILGLDVLGDKLVDIDFRAMKVSLLTGAEADKAAGGLVAAERVMGGLLAVPVEVNGTPGTAIIDTGARETRVNSAFAKAAKLPAGTDGTQIFGATNVATTLVASTARTVTFAGVALRDTPIRIADLSVFADFGLKDKPAMLLGADYLKDVRLLVDFRTGKVGFR